MIQRISLCWNYRNTHDIFQKTIQAFVNTVREVVDDQTGLALIANL